jgi:NADPH:quinone reductase-like Zn-dependent oxidoreductase
MIAGAGGVGSMAIQSGCMLGLDVVATTSRPESTEWCGALGASAVIDHRAPVADGLRAAGYHLVDRVPICANLDHYWPQLAEPIRRQGAICSIVANRMPIDLKAVMHKYSRFCWEAMFARSNFDTPDLIEQHRLLGRIASWIDAGQIRRTATGRLAPINAANLRAFTGGEHPSDHADQ